MDRCISSCFIINYLAAMGQHVSLPFFSHNAMFYFRNSIHDDVSFKKYKKCLIFSCFFPLRLNRLKNQ
jgi:hypothetical protein